MERSTIEVQSRRSSLFGRFGFGCIKLLAVITPIRMTRASMIMVTAVELESRKPCPETSSVFSGVGEDVSVERGVSVARDCTITKLKGVPSILFGAGPVLSG